jgi:uncharacterized protein (DUF1330 family)
MQIENALYPSPEQLKVLESSEGPIVMLNLLKFRGQAQYKDRDDNISGAEAYDRYAEKFKVKLQQLGGRIIFWSDVRSIVIGSVEQQWDAVLLVEYPSAKSFLTAVTDPDVATLTIDRRAGLAGQLLLETAARQIP